MKKKKYLIGLALAALSLTTLVACGDVTIVNNDSDNKTDTTPTTDPTPTPEPVVVEQKEDSLKLNVENKMYDGEKISLTCTTTSGKAPKIEYKNALDDDTAYSTTAPKEPGKYIVRATLEDTPEYKGLTKTKEFKIKTLYEPAEYKALEGTNAYVKVSTPAELFAALKSAQYDYTNTLTGITVNDGYVVRNNVRKNATNWTNAITKGLYIYDDENDEYIKIPSDESFENTSSQYLKDTYYEDSPYSTVTYTQTLNNAPSIKVIEIANDMDLGYNLISSVSQGLASSWDNKNRLAGKTDIYADSDMQTAGISKININKYNDLIIYSKNGSKLTHCGFNVSACKDVKFDNIEMDEMWMWEDSNSTSPTQTIGDYDAFGWAYFKIGFSENITITHCTFGKSFDGQIDYSNPFYQSMGTYSNAPYEGTGNNGLTVSFCDFKAGSDNEDGYLYRMMDKIENEYQVYAANKTGYSYTNKSCRYYFTLRDQGLTFDDILYGIAIPQKKAFLWGDSGDSYLYNKYLNATLCNCTIKNIEDRLPKVRGGMAYVYNVLVDNTEYLKYVPKLKSVSLGNSKYKLAGVSQGILAGLDASIYLESVEYRGISSYLKNNDSLPSSDKRYPTVNGGYMIKNSIIGDKQGSSTDSTNPFIGLVADTNKLSTEYFSFKINGEKTDLTEPPFTIDAYDLLANGSLTKYFKDHTTGTF